MGLKDKLLFAICMKAKKKRTKPQSQKLYKRCTNEGKQNHKHKEENTNKHAHDHIHMYIVRYGLIQIEKRLCGIDSLLSPAAAFVPHRRLV